MASGPGPALAQTPTGQGTDEGPQRGRSYFSPEPFEYFDFQNGDLQLSFTDLVLPGNAGRDLRFVRSYSNLGIGWKFGIAGIVMQVLGGYMPEAWEITTENAYHVYTQSAPKLVMGDGGTRQTFYTQDPDPEVPSTQRIVKTADHIVYNQDTRKVFMPNGVVCRYHPQGAPYYGYLDYCDDPFGRFLTFIPTNWPSAWTYRQELGNGQFRDVLLTGSAPTGITTMTYANRVWQYVYSSSTLTTVTPPVGPSWTFTYDPSSSGWVTFLKSVTTPGGGYIEYTYADHWQMHPEAPDPFDNHFHGYLLTTRSASGPDVEPGTWTITPDYEEHGPQESEQSRPVPATRMTVLLPSGVAREWSNCYGPPANPDVGFWIVGNLPCGGFDTGYPKDFGSLPPLPLIAYQWASLYTQDAIGSIFVADRSGPITLLSTHELVHTAFDAYRQPTTTVESSSLYPGRQRQTTRTYLNLVPASFDAPTMPYILGLPDSETVALDGAEIESVWMYNTARGFRTSETIAGVTTTFTPDARGNVATMTKANQKVTQYTSTWGQVQEIQTPEHTRTRVIDAYGQIESETQGDVTTAYAHDLLGRRTTTHTLGTEAVITTYNDAARTVTTQRGASTATTWLDGFGRPIETLTGAGVRTSTEYDAEGRVTRQSLPYPTGGTPVWTQFEYDWIGRLAKETHAGGSYRQRTYGPGMTTVRDENGRLSVVTRQSLSHPDDGPVTGLLDAAGETWQYTYNMLGHLTQVLGPGGVTRSWVYDDTTKRLESETHPESGTVTYDDYDAAGVLKRRPMPTAPYSSTRMTATTVWRPSRRRL